MRSVLKGINSGYRRRDAPVGFQRVIAKFCTVEWSQGDAGTSILIYLCS